MPHDIEDLERQGWSALSGPDGATYYADLMLDAGLMVFPGTIMTKDQALAAIREAQPWSWFKLTDIRIAGQGDVATVAYRATAQRGDGPPYVAAMSSTYVRDAGRWRLLLHQQSP